MDIFLAAAVLALVPPISPDVPNRQPQFAVSGDNLALVYGTGKSIMFAKSRDGGRTLTKPVEIAQVPVLPLGRHRGPRVAFSGKTIVVTAVGGSTVATGPHAHGLPSDGNLLAWRSTDGGATWSKAVTINDSPASAREGLHALAADDNGNITAVWLDLRAQGTRLYAASSTDGGSSWSPNFKLYESPDGTICQCCHPSLVAFGRGEFAVMFRNVLAGNRDMYTLRFTTGKIISGPDKAGAGTWAINACPMDGGGIVLSKGRMVTAWRRDQDVFLATTGGPEIRLGRGRDVALAARGDRIFVVWNEAGGLKSYVSGRESLLAKEGSFPTIAVLTDGNAVTAWEENGTIAVRRLE